MKKHIRFFTIVSFALLAPTLALAQWSGPTATPPGNNASAPLNTSSTGQSKSGGLILNTSGAANGLIVQSGAVGIGTTNPGYTLDVNGSARATDSYADSWFRVNGGGGIYWQQFGGGWYMQDGTWIRSYNSKPVYMSAGYDSGSAAGAGCGGGLGGGYTFQVCGNENVQSDLTVGNGGPGTVHLWGSNVYDTGDGLHLAGGNGNTSIDGNLCLNGDCINDWNVEAPVGSWCGFRNNSTMIPCQNNDPWYSCPQDYGTVQFANMGPGLAGGWYTCMKYQ
jgi:hypothetical protein